MLPKKKKASFEKFSIPRPDICFLEFLYCISVIKFRLSLFLRKIPRIQLSYNKGKLIPKSYKYCYQCRIQWWWWWRDGFVCLKNILRKWWENSEKCSYTRIHKVLVLMKTKTSEYCVSWTWGKMVKIVSLNHLWILNCSYCQICITKKIIFDWTFSIYFIF